VNWLLHAIWPVSVFLHSPIKQHGLLELKITTKRFTWSGTKWLIIDVAKLVRYLLHFILGIKHINGIFDWTLVFAETLDALVCNNTI